MEKSSKKMLIGIDGGGTKTEFVLVDEDGELYARRVLAGSNPNTYGIEKAISCLETGIRELIKPGFFVSAVGAGVAGFASGDNGKKILAALENDFPDICFDCDTDIANVFALSEHPEKDRVVAICGTGCVVWAKDKEGMHRVGGGGYFIDPAASGFDLGKRVIRAALDEIDGIGDKTVLLPMAEEKLGCSLWDGIPRVYREGVPFVASFAPLAFKAAEMKDEVACRIVDENAGRLAALCKRGLEIAGYSERILLSGSVFTKNPLYIGLLHEKLGGATEIVIPKGSQSWGACLRAARACGLLKMPSEERFLARYEQEKEK